MDGAPVKGESIPIRVFLAGYDLTPTMRDINKKFSVKYYLNLVLVDEEERRYFKQQEITLWRKGERVRKPHQMSSAGANAVYQIPHAMARHEAGDHPTQNIRTAPTPSEPNTPVVDPALHSTVPIPGPQKTVLPAAVPEAEPEQSEPVKVDLPPSLAEAPRNDVVAPEKPEEAPKNEDVLEEKDTPKHHSDKEEAKEEVLNDSKPTEGQNKDSKNSDSSKKEAPAEKVPTPTDGAGDKKAPAESEENNVSPHNFMESPPPMDDSITGDNEEDLSGPEQVDLSDELEDDEEEEEAVETATDKKKSKSIKEREPVAL